MNSKILNLCETPNSLESFLSQLNNICLDLNCKITYLYLVLLARYPSLKELQEINFRCRTESFSEIAQIIMKGKEFRRLLENKKTQYNLVEAKNECVYLDTTETLFAPFNTGVQRVARSVFKNAMAIPGKACFFARIGNPLRPYILSTKELQRLKDWQETVLFQKAELISWRSFYKAFLKDGLLKEIVDCTRRDLQYKLFEHFNSPRGNVQIPVFQESSRLLLVEVPLKPGRIVFYESLKSTFKNLSLSMILYDLLPLTRPEFFENTVKLAFAEYLRLFRYVNKVSCISATVQNDLEGFLQCYRSKNWPIVKTHLLAAFDSISEASNNEDGKQENKEILPYILCVGTIEPRKNQLSLIRAASLLWERGVVFKLYFVGALGWQSWVFLDEVKKYKDKYPGLLNFFNHVDDLTLKSLYKNAKATAFVSLAEGFGLPLLESLSALTPCITTNNGSTKEIAELAGGCLLVNPLSIDEIAASIETVLTNAQEYARLKQETLRFNWHSWKDYTIDILDFSLCISDRFSGELTKS